MFYFSTYWSKSLQSSILRFYSKRPFKRVLKSVRQGVVIGREEQLSNGMAYQCFQGLPYAVPPIGDLRFKSPVPLEHFNTTQLNCTRLRDPCHHQEAITKKVIGSEDCLHLNIYAPAKRSAKPLPVMIWIHGGGFIRDTGNNYLPLSLLDKGVIVVTLNYRLGAWGFLCLPEAGVWGNAGIKDQRLALQWVHENIENFNGDPSNVTLFGESAGAACVHLHAMTSHAGKLFHKMIIQSGAANIEWIFQRQPNIKARRLCEVLGCESKDPRKMLKFLQSPEKVTLEAVMFKNMSLLLPDERRRGFPFPLRPVLEDPSSPDTIINTPVLQQMRQIDTRTIPTMIGYNSAEGLTLLKHFVKHIQEVNQDLERFVPRNIPLPINDPEMEHKRFVNFILELAIHQPRDSLYACCFDYTGGRDFYKRAFEFEHFNGACHGDELHYLFQAHNDDLNTFKVDDAKITKRLSAMWANFARYGEPTPENSEISKDLGFTWTPVDKLSVGECLKLDYLNVACNEILIKVA